MSNKIEYSYLWGLSKDKPQPFTQLFTNVSSMKNYGHIENSEVYLCNGVSWTTHPIEDDDNNNEYKLWKVLVEKNNDTGSLTFHKPVLASEPPKHDINVKMFVKSELQPSLPTRNNLGSWTTNVRQEVVWVSELDSSGKWSEPKQIQ